MKIKEIFKNWWKWLVYHPEEIPLSGPKIVAIGGGSGLANLLGGLRKYTFNLSAIITVFDSGGSSGRLRRDFNIPALGDIRNCLVALAEKSELMRDIFDYRFKKGRGLKGHSLGNLLLTAIFNMSSNLEEVVKVASAILNIKGEVIPASLENSHLWAELSNGIKIKGEAKIPEEVVKRGSPIKDIWLSPQVKANPLAIKAIKNAEFVLIGPGSLYTSILPNFEVLNIKEAVNKTKAPVIYIANIAQERGETMGFTVEDHIDKLLDGGVMIDLCLVNNRILKRAKDIKKFGEIENISTKKDVYRGVKIIKEDLINIKNPLYHDSLKLAKIIMRLNEIE